jgi:hypothetical protein
MQSDAGADRNDSALNTVGKKIATVQVLAATESFASAAFLAHDFCNESSRVARFGDVVPVAAMIGENHIVRSEALGHEYSRKFLPYRCVDRAVNSPLLEQLQQLPFDRPYLVGLQKLRVVLAINAFHILFTARLRCDPTALKGIDPVPSFFVIRRRGQPLESQEASRRPIEIK